MKKKKKNETIFPNNIIYTYISYEPDDDTSTSQFRVIRIMMTLPVSRFKRTLQSTVTIQTLNGECDFDKVNWKC